MAYRFTNTDKWQDAWFFELKPLEKLLFNYLCDNCDIAGFIELTERKFVVDIGCDTRGLQGALKGLTRGLIYSDSGDCIYVRKFLKHQKNLPLNENNKAHLGIIKRFELYSIKFNIQSIDEFIEGALKGLSSPIGIGKGKGSGKGVGKTPIEESEIPSFKDFKAYALENEPNININDLKLKYKSWEVNGWKTGKGVKIKNWKSVLLNTIPHINKNNSTYKHPSVLTDQERNYDEF